MYHVKNDKRSQKSAELAVDAMDECLSVHGFENLTITELCSVSTIGRATFYRLFDTLEDVVAYKCELFALEFSNEIPGNDIKTIQLNFFKKWMSNIEFLKLIVSLRRTDIIFDCHRNHLEQLRPYFMKLGMSEYITDYHIVLLTNTLVGALLVWCEHGCKESAEEVIASCSKAMKDIGLLFSA